MSANERGFQQTKEYVKAMKVLSFVGKNANFVILA